MTLPALVDRLRELADRVREFPSRRTQRQLLIAAIPLFLAAGVWAYLSAELDWRDVQLLPLLAAFFVAVPLTAIVNGWEFSSSARLLGQRISLRSAMRVTIVATALNYLPGHGGALFRVQNLRRSGPGYRRSSAATLVMGLVWVGLAGIASGTLLLIFSPSSAAWLFGGIGIAATGLAGVILAAERRDRGQWGRWTGLITVVEATSIGVTALRLYLVMYAVGIPVSATAAFVLTLAVVLGSATGLMPGGLGIREVLAGAFAPVVGLSPALGFLVIGIDRVLGLLGHVPLAIYILRTGLPAPRGHPPG